MSPERVKEYQEHLCNYRHLFKYKGLAMPSEEFGAIMVDVIKMLQAILAELETKWTLKR